MLSCESYQEERICSLYGTAAAGFVAAASVSKLKYLLPCVTLVSDKRFLSFLSASTQILKASFQHTLDFPL